MLFTFTITFLHLWNDRHSLRIVTLSGTHRTISSLRAPCCITEHVVSRALTPGNVTMIDNSYHVLITAEFQCAIIIRYVLQNISRNEVPWKLTSHAMALLNLLHSQSPLNPHLLPIRCINEPVERRSLSRYVDDSRGRQVEPFACRLDNYIGWSWTQVSLRRVCDPDVNNLRRVYCKQCRLRQSLHSRQRIGASSALPLMCVWLTGGLF